MQPNAENAPTTENGRWVVRALRPMRGERERLRALAVIAAVLSVIGWLDYLTGSRASFVIFYLMPVSLAVIWFGRTAGVAAAAASVVIRFAADTYADSDTLQQTWLWWNSLGSLLVYLLVTGVLGALIRLQRELEARVRDRTDALEREQRSRQAIQAQLLELSASERSAMGLELHDQLAQHLVGTAMAAQVLAQRLSTRDEAAAREARKIADLVEQGIAETRQLARGLMLSHVAPERLGSEIEEMCANLRQQFPRVDCACEIEPHAPLPRDAATAAQVLRITQEALRNALRHSGGDWVRVRLAGHGGRLRIEVEDNGRGLPPVEALQPGMGLGIMRHRAEHIGAELTFSSRPGGGTIVTCGLPPQTPPPA